MTIRLATAAALAPLFAASAAQAQVTISNTRTTPVLTSTVSGGAAADVIVSGDGAVEVARGVAITGDSDNTIVLEEGSAIIMEEAADGATGVLLEAGHAGDLTLGGAISITDDIDFEDEDEDGDGDGPFASGGARYGVRVSGDGVRTGDILMEDTGSLYLEGNDSTGVSIESALVGDLTVLGSISVTGDRTVGIRVAGDMDGDVLLSGGSVAVTGEDAVGVSVEANVSGALQIQSSVSSTGYRYAYRPPSIADLDDEAADGVELSDESLYLEDLDADDLLQGGPAVQVSASVGGGVFLGAAPAYSAYDGEDGDDDDDGVRNGDEDDDADGVKNTDDDDRDGDGLLDEDEGTASLTTFGSAPALVIGAATSDIVIGAYDLDDAAHGLINQGTIAASGVFDDIEATAVLIGGGTGSTRIEGGFLNEGAISASAYEANATTVRLSSGADLPTLINSGSVTASATTENLDTATALQIDATASLSSLDNSGTIAAYIYGEAGDAVAINDASGTVSSLTNTGSIVAAIIATDNDDDDDTTDETITGQTIAINFSANTAGVALTQAAPPADPLTDYDGDGLADGEDPDDDDDGLPDAEDDEDNDDDNDGVVNALEPAIIGDILLGSGADVVDIRNGIVIGDLSMGAGADTLSISGGATYEGALSDADGLLDITVSEGELRGLQGETLNATSLTVGNGGEIFFTVDPAAGTAGDYVVSGAAAFADGSTISLHLDSLVDADGETFRLVTAGSLSYGDVQGGDLSGESPYMIVSSYTADQAAGTVDVTLRPRSTTEMALSGVESSGYDAFYNALGRDEEVMDAFLAQTNREDFMNLYEQTLPDHSGGTLMSLASGIDAVTQALAGRLNTAALGEASAWVQEINFYEDKDKTDTYGYRAEGFGIAGGYERMTRVGALGVSVALAASELEDPEAEAEEQLSSNLLELGLYWRAQSRGWTGWARGAVGYAAFESTRSLVSDDVYVTSVAEWDGYTLSAAGGVAYERRIGRLSLRPEAYAEFFRLTESSRTESGGGEAFDLEIDGRTGHVASGTAALKIGYGFGADQGVRPELKLGWKQVFSSDYDETTARYVSGGDSFALTGEPLQGGGPVVGLGLAMGNALSSFTVSGDAQLLEDYVRYSFLIRATFAF
ncbi:MAG: autotransporter outer membrane beta-barrel domain-containing protein [Brevundimonas sp.]|nr:autotransporter outer membrane beta-barrel domain-containing protein [Brevundimonas sp.]